MFTPRPRCAPNARPPARPPLVEWLPFPAKRDLRAMLGRGFRHTRRGFRFPVGWTLERSETSMGDRTYRIRRANGRLWATITHMAVSEYDYPCGPRFSYS